MIHLITQNVIDIFTFFRDFVGIYYYITETGSWLLDWRTSGKLGLRSFRFVPW